LLPRSRDATGQQRVVLLRAPKFSPRQPAPPCCCALAPACRLAALNAHWWRDSPWHSPRPWQVLSPQRLRVHTLQNSETCERKRLSGRQFWTRSGAGGTWNPVVPWDRLKESVTLRSFLWMCGLQAFSS
jgi:hypothetical protein